MKALKLPMLFLLFISLSSMQCKKNETKKKDELPPETQSGENTFGCLVNGEVWLPKAKFPYSSINIQVLNDYLSIGAGKGNSSSIFLEIRNLNSVGQYPLIPKDARASYFTKIADKNYELTEGNIEISKYDKEKKIISGRFWFKAKSESGETIDITDGRFDLNCN